ncbi:N-acetyltransferase [Halomonas organivorans]
MEFSPAFEGREDAIIELFTATFTASEGAEEGRLIGDLVRHQLTGTVAPDLQVFLAESGGTIIAGAIFTRLTYDRDERTVFVLGPVAVATEHQGEGIGRALLTHALKALRHAGVDIAVTYGDPAYYARVGFQPINEEFAPAPFRLRHPEGWLGQSLTEAEMTPLRGSARCVEALDDPVFW